MLLNKANSNTSREILDKEILIERAKNLNTLPETLDNMFDIGIWEVRSAIAGNPNTLSETLDRMIYDKNWIVRLMVAENPNTPFEALVKMKNDKNEDVLETVLEKISLRENDMNKTQLKIKSQKAPK